MAKNYLDKWEEEDDEFRPNERLAEVLELVKKGVVKQKVYEELLRTTREAALGIKRTTTQTNWRQRALIGGHLFRRVSKKRWKKNWFALYSNKLEYFKSKNQGLLGTIEITEEHYCSDYSTSNNAAKGGIRPFGFMLSNFEDTIYLAATSKDLKQYWIDRIQQVIKKLKADAKLEDKPVLLNKQKDVPLETRMKNYRASVRKRNEAARGSYTEGPRATLERASSKRGTGRTKGSQRQHGSALSGGTAGAAVGGAGMAGAVVAGGTVSAERKQNRRKKRSKEGGRQRKEEVPRGQYEGSSEHTEELSELGSLPGEAIGTTGGKKFSLQRQRSDDAIPQKVEFDTALQGGARKTYQVPVAAKPKIRIQFAEKGTSARSSVRGSVPKKAAGSEDTRSEQRSIEHAVIAGLKKKREADEESFDSSFSRQLGAASSLGSYQKPNTEQKLGPAPALTSLFGTVIPTLLERIRGGTAKEIENEEKQEEEEEEDLKNVRITKEAEQVVEKKFGLLVRTQSYEQGLTEEVELTKKENQAVQQELEKVNKVEEALELQEKLQKRALERAAEEGDKEGEARVAAELKETQQIAEEQEGRSAEIWVQRQKLQDELQEKERELAKMQVARELAQETSRQAERKLESEKSNQLVNEKIKSANAALEEAQAASLLAQKAMENAQAAARKIRERAEKDKERIASVKEELVQKETELQTELGEIEKQVTKVKHKTAAGQGGPQLLKALDVLESAKEKKAEEVRRLSEGRKLLEEHDKQIDNKKDVLEEILKEEEEAEKPKLKKLGGDARPKSVMTTSTRGRQRKEEMSKSHLNFLVSFQKEQDELEKEAKLKEKEVKLKEMEEDDGEESEEDEFVVDAEEEDEDEERDEETEKLKAAAEKLTDEERREADFMFFTEQIKTLIDTIEEFGQVDKFGRSCIKFGELAAKYEEISDGLVGILMKAKDAKRVKYKGDMLLVDKDADVLITVI